MHLVVVEIATESKRLEIDYLNQLSTSLTE